MQITREKLLRALREPAYLAEVGRRRVENARLWWRQRSEVAAPPRFVTLFLTNQCNLRCRMCAQYGESGKSFEVPRETLPAELIFRVVDELAPYGTSFTLMGGEPTLYHRWAEVARYIKSKNLSCDIITNGTLLRRDAEELVGSRIDLVNVSLDGLGEVNDQIRGRGTYEKIAGGLEVLLKARREGGGGHPRIVLFFIINTPNYGRLVEFAEWASRLGVDGITFFHLRFYNQQNYLDNAEFMQRHFGQSDACQEGFVYDPGYIETEVLSAQIREVKSRPWPLEVKFQPDHPLEELEAYYHDENYQRRALKNCPVPWTAASISPSSTVIPCLDLECGDLRRQSFMEIWNGERYRKFRRVFRQEGRLPVCHRCCV